MIIRLYQEADTILDIVRELREAGLVGGRDFDFSYHPTEYDPDGWSVAVHRHADIKFFPGHEKWATLLALRFS